MLGAHVLRLYCTALYRNVTVQLVMQGPSECSCSIPQVLPSEAVLPVTALKKLFKATSSIQPTTLMFNTVVKLQVAPVLQTVVQTRHSRQAPPSLT